MACRITVSRSFHRSDAAHVYHASAGGYAIISPELHPCTKESPLLSSGAIALMAVVNEDIHSLGWYFLPVILLSTSFVLVLALVLNNIQRRYPVFWFSPDDDNAPTAPEQDIRVQPMIALSSGQRTIVEETTEDISNMV